ncbi:DUF7563 family protein [Halorubrum sp. SY-15]|jgi:predicted  nucleic acid-binding Zn-ribbon protein|uniref:DUF7563 family protein n=1 Tax=Halorubrum sp. SY-15 TaxID=3402277 RepID=UPI003EBE1824
MSDHDRESGHRCSRCGSAVSHSFVRVFGLEGEVHGCLDCRPRRELSQGDAAKRRSDRPRATMNRDWRSTTDSPADADETAHR